MIPPPPRDVEPEGAEPENSEPANAEPANSEPENAEPENAELQNEPDVVLSGDAAPDTNGQRSVQSTAGSESERRTSGSLDELPQPAPSPSRVRNRFTRRRATPPGIAWYGFRSVWGHLRHFIASAIATDGIDARDWMRPDAPERLLRRIVKRLGGDPDAKSLAGAMGGEVWIDYLADSGEHALVTEAVARMVFAEYRLTDGRGEALAAPRGRVLIFGGDTAYPVATVKEIHDRLTVPFNRAGKEVEPDGVPRVILGIPGNHDWYDGLDGFSRMFRRKRWGEEEEVRPSLTKMPSAVLGESLDFVGSFVAGEEREKAGAVLIDGYRPVQSASYWCIPLAGDVDLFGVDRQLRRVDGQQVEFFRKRRRRRDAKPWVLLPDPVMAFGKESKTGRDTIDRLPIDLDEEEALVLSGDIHHYRREQLGAATHVTAGGGGAFLHPTPMTTEGRSQAEAEWPSKEQSKAILRNVPWHVMAGRAGTIPHTVMLLLFAPALGVGGFWGRHAGMVSASVVAAIVASVVYALLGNIRTGPRLKVASLSLLAGAMTGLVPAMTAALVAWAESRFSVSLSAWWSGALSLLMAVYFGGFTFGAYLSALTLFGLEETQAFTAIAHPGFKHFLRARVREDGQVDCWVLGLEDPLGEAEVVLVDHFQWNGPAGEALQDSADG